MDRTINGRLQARQERRWWMVGWADTACVDVNGEFPNANDSTLTT